MPRSRFIYQYLHIRDIVNAAASGNPDYDQLFDVRGFVNHLKTRSSKCWWSYTVKLKIFSSIYAGKTNKIRNKNGETRMSTSGYCLDLDIYTGK